MQTAAARGLTGGEIVNDGAKIARVKVEGKANGVPFSVERSVRRYQISHHRFGKGLGALY